MPAFIAVHRFMFADGLDADDGTWREPGLEHRPGKLLGRLLDRLVPVAGLHDQRDALTA